MSANNIPDRLASVERLIQRVNAAEKSQQKEIRISIQEARELTSELSIITAKLGRTIQDIYTAINELKESSANISVKFDGGGFNWDKYIRG